MGRGEGLGAGKLSQVGSMLRCSTGRETRLIGDALRFCQPERVYLGGVSSDGALSWPGFWGQGPQWDRRMHRGRDFQAGGVCSSDENPACVAEQRARNAQKKKKRRRRSLRRCRSPCSLCRSRVPPPNQSFEHPSPPPRGGVHGPTGKRVHAGASSEGEESGGVSGAGVGAQRRGRGGSGSGDCCFRVCVFASLVVCAFVCECVCVSVCVCVTVL